jgi:hypothetical protein
VADNPYASIAARYAFKLVPAPAANAPDAASEPDQSTKITPNGIMSLFGPVQVLFKVATPAQPGQPPQVQSYVLGEGDRADGITVTRIDQPNRMVTFDNHGVVQTIPLVNAEGVSGPAVGPGAPPANPPSSRPVRDRFAAGSASASDGDNVATPNPGNRAANTFESA